MCTHKYIYIYMYVCLFVCIMYVCMYVRTYVCLCVCVCMYKCMDAIINVYAYLCVYERMFSSLLVFSTSLIMPLPLHLCTHIPSASILVSRNFFPWEKNYFTLKVEAESDFEMFVTVCQPNGIISQKVLILIFPAIGNNKCMTN